MTACANILLVEDNHLDVELTLDAFREVRLTNNVQVVRDGVEALDYLLRRGTYVGRKDYCLPDLVLLDLKMPKVDGHEVLRQMRAHPATKRIPVIVLTSSTEEGDRALSYDSGANSYLVKPVSFDGFLDVIRRIENYWLQLNVGPPAEMRG